MEKESEEGNIGKYQRVKGGKTAERSGGYGVLWKVSKRNVDTLCRKLSLKYHLLLNLKAARIRSQEKYKSVFQDPQLQRLTHVRLPKAY